MDLLIKRRNEYNIKKLDIIDDYLPLIRSKDIVKIIKKYSIPEIIRNSISTCEDFFERIYGEMNGLHYKRNINHPLMGNVIEKSIWKKGSLILTRQYYYHIQSHSHIQSLFLHKLLKYSNNKLLYTKIYHTNGKVKERYSFDRDKLLHGKHYEYNENSNEHILTIYDHGIAVNTNIW